MRAHWRGCFGPGPKFGPPVSARGPLGTLAAGPGAAPCRRPPSPSQAVRRTLSHLCWSPAVASPLAECTQFAAGSTFNGRLGRLNSAFKFMRFLSSRGSARKQRSYSEHQRPACAALLCGPGPGSSRSVPARHDSIELRPTRTGFELRRRVPPSLQPEGDRPGCGPASCKVCKLASGCTVS